MPFKPTDRLGQSGSGVSAYQPEMPVFCPSGSFEDSPFPIIRETPSIGASNLSFIGSLKLATVATTLALSVTFSSDTVFAKALCPERLAVPCIATVAPQSETEFSRAQTIPSPSLEAQRQLVSAIKGEPLEDGVVHPAEELIAKFYEKHGDNELFSLISSQTSTNSAITASAIRLLGRANYIDADLQQRVISLGLASPSIEIRDAAVQAAELWGDGAVVSLLRSHREPCPWLADYVNRVVRDLSGNPRVSAC